MPTDTGDVTVEIIHAGDEIDAVFKKDGHVYVYPLDEVRDVVGRLEASGADIVDRTVDGVYTVYSQEEYYE